MDAGTGTPTEIDTCPGRDYRPIHCRRQCSTGPPPKTLRLCVLTSRFRAIKQGLAKKCVNEIRRRPSCCPRFSPRSTEVYDALGDLRQALGRIEAAEALLCAQQCLSDDRRRVLHLLEPLRRHRPQPHRRERRLNHPRRPEMHPVLPRECVESQLPPSPKLTRWPGRASGSSDEIDSTTIGVRDLSESQAGEHLFLRSSHSAGVDKHGNARTAQESRSDCSSGAAANDHHDGTKRPIQRAVLRQDLV